MVGTALRVAYIGRPFDHRVRSPWRQADYVQIARNYYREDGNIFFPRIDWRGTTPGYVETEFPLIPWIAGTLYRGLGYHEPILRGLSAVLEVAGLMLFASFARRLLTPPAMLFALGSYAVNPLLVHLASAMQPEPLMLFLSLLSVFLVVRYNDDPRDPVLFRAAAALAAAILAKATAACLGIVFAWVVFRRHGPRVLSRPKIWAAASIALLPPLAWYAWAKHFWLSYGNSLGISNEPPFIGRDLLWPPYFLLHLFQWETLAVVTPLGWLLLAASRRARRAQIAIPLVWLTSVYALYLMGARTIADSWAFYYHSASVAPACLLMGAGFGSLWRAEGTRVLLLPPGLLRQTVAALLGVGVIACLSGATAYLVHARDNRADLMAMRACGLQFVAHIRPEDSIVVKGGAARDEHGSPVAYNASMQFAWLDRKGFNYPTDAFSVDTLRSIAAKGGRYWIAEDAEVALLEGAASRYFLLMDRCSSGFSLYDLQRSPAVAPANGLKP